MRSPRAARRLGAAAVLGAIAAVGCGRDRAAAEAEGAALYRMHGCAVCHGEQGRGDGEAAAALARRPLDFRDPAALRRGSTIAAIADSIAGGTADATAPGMPAFTHIPRPDRERIAAFITALRQETP